MKCNSCGNTTKFYRNITIVAKLRVDRNGEDLKTIYDIDKDNIQDWYEPIYCCNCDEQVGESSGEN